MNKVVRGTLLILAFCAFMAFGFGADKVSASSAMIEFTSSDSSVDKGNSFTVLMTVNGSDGIKSVDAYVSYDSTKMDFAGGGKYVSGSNGLLHVAADDLDGSKTSVKFSLQFEAVGEGNVQIGISDTANVYDNTGTQMSTSSNRVSVTLKGNGESTEQTQTESQLPDITSTASSDNKLKELLVSDGKLKPAFSPDVSKYSLTVDNKTENLYFSFKASDSQAVVTLTGNKGLKEGKNKVKILVAAPNRDIRTYTIKVKRETAEESRQRAMSEGGVSGNIGFDVMEENGEVYIRNSYEFKIVDVENSELIPSGYVKTSVRLYGVNVTAYTMANDLENDFLLMYCMNSNGDKEFYQYDRQEKSLQRYTGNLIDRVNSSNLPESAEDMTAKEYEDNLNQLAIIIAVLAAVGVLLVLCIISMTIKNIKSKSGKDEDELDF